MNTNTLKKFAQEANKKLMAQIGAKMDYVLNTDSVELREKEPQIKRLRDEITKTSKAQVIDKVAYTWFNRLMALRFMDVNDFQPLGVRVISPKDGFTTPELLEEVKQGHIPADLPVKKDKIFDLLDGKIPSPNPQNEVFKELLIGACNHLHKTLPFLFERINDYTDLLLPDDLTSDFSIVQDIRNGMSAKDCKEVEIIGWLYQFYISEKKDVLINAKKSYKADEIPAVTQLFTPKWIVEYMVDNTLGQLWKEARPNTTLTNELKFYIKPENPELIPIRKLKSPEEITFFDPCVGSAHVLCYAFDVFYRIYEEEGYVPSEIPELILTKNLFGVDIDDRAAQLAGFALMMKGRKYSRRFLAKGVDPHIMAFQNSKLHSKFENAKMLGSLIKITPTEAAAIAVDKNSLFSEEQEQLKKQAKLLSDKYDLVVTNPPYLNSSYMEIKLKQFVEEEYKETKSDLFACFFMRSFSLTKEDGLIGLISPFVWMFLGSYERLRKEIIEKTTVSSLIQLEYNGFGAAMVPVETHVFRNTFIDGYKGSYIKLSDFKGPENQMPKTLEAIQNSSCGWFFTANQKDFKKIPASPIGYWLSGNAVNAFAGSLSNEILIARHGLLTGNDSKYVKYWFETSFTRIGVGCRNYEDMHLETTPFYPLNKGGGRRKWYGNLDYIVFLGDFKSTFNSNKLNESHLFFKEGITWSEINTGGISCRYSKQGILFGHKGPTAFFKDKKLLEYFLGFSNSKPFNLFKSVINSSISFTSGNMEVIPTIVCQEELNKINKVVIECVEIASLEWNSRETSWDFYQNELLRIKSQDLVETYDLYQQYWKNKFFQVHKIEEEINKRFVDIYGLRQELTPDVPLEEITILQDELNGNALKVQNARLERDPETGLISDYSNIQLTFDAKEIFSQFVSYAVGCMFGRYSLDKEGLILANQGEILEDYLRTVTLSGVEVSFLPDKDNIIPILDDEWFEDDIVSRFKEFLRVTFGKENLEKNLAFVESAIGKDIRKYFVKDFYTDHIQRYKKRPIYWMFSSPNGSFNVLIYMHRYTPDTLSKILNDYLNQYREKLRARVEHLDQMMISGSSTEQTKADKEKGKIRTVLLELQEYERDILYPFATERISIDLDEGVLVNYNKFGKAIKEVAGLNDKKAKEKVREFDWIDATKIN